MSRGFKFNFSEGERVLCYEPDPNKAKVLYDSKILECCVRKDGSRTKKTAEYLVHFYGWNSSWDRHVAEQNILKDNPDNRALQRQLAEIAAEQLKGKKLKLNKIPAIIKEVVVGLTPASSSSHQSHDSNSKDSNTSAKDKDEISMDEFDSNLCNTQSEINSDNNNLISENSQCDDGPLLQPSFLQLSDELKTILEKDAQFIDNGKSYSLPAKYTVKMILEKYLDDTNNFNNGNNSCSVSTRNRKSSASKEARLILKEFVTSLEMYFDTILPDHLLYSEEKRIDILSSTSSSSSHFKTPYSQIYGFIHLLRLLTVLPEFFAATPGITKKQLNILFKLFQEFIAFLTKNRSIFIDH